MAENTRTVLIWFDNDRERLTFAVNPKSITVSRPRATREFTTIDGEVVHASRGRGLMTVALATFLPGPDSRFYRGVHPLSALAMLKRWQDSQRPVRLIISDTDINDAFLLTELRQTIAEGDQDIQISLSLREYKFVTLEGRQGALPASGSGLAPRADTRQVPKTHTVQKGETLWGIATKYFGDGTRWREIADKNGISEPRLLPIGRVLTL